MGEPTAAGRATAFSLKVTLLCALLLALSPFLHVEGQDVVLQVGNWHQAVPGACLFKSVTGLDCPFCGLSRGYVCAAHFDFEGALRHNWAALPALALVAFYAAGGAVERFRRRVGAPAARSRAVLSAAKTFLAAVLSAGWLVKLLIWLS